MSKQNMKLLGENIHRIKNDRVVIFGIISKMKKIDENLKNVEDMINNMIEREDDN